MQTGLVVQDLHPDHRAEAGHAVRLQHQDQGARDASARTPTARARTCQLPDLQNAEGPTKGTEILHAVQRDHALDQHLLRPARAAGRPVQRGQDRGRHGHDRADGQSLFAAVGNPHHPIKTDYQEPADDNPTFTLGSGLRVDHEHGRRLRLRRRARLVLQADRDPVDRRPGRSKLPVESAACHRDMLHGGRRRRLLHPAGRAHLRHRGQPPAGPSAARPRPRPAPATAATTPPSPGTRPSWPATCRCSTR